MSQSTRSTSAPARAKVAARFAAIRVLPSCGAALVTTRVQGRSPQETFYDGYVVNAIMDACYRSAKKHAWEPVELDWRGGSTPRSQVID